MAPDIVLTPSTQKLVSELCEVGWLFKKVNDWNTRNSGMEHQGKVVKALSFAIDSELKEYYRLVALLDSQRT
jgi:gamma-tubulin complex component 3